MSKQTAIDWLVEQIFNDVDLKDGILKLAIQQAKEKEKEQIKNAFGVGSRFERIYLDQYHYRAEDYFTQNYGQ